MHPRRLRTLLVATSVLGVSSLLSACGSGDGGGESAAPVDALSGTALVSYAFLDASVPPQFHRSYELTVTADTSRMVVDSYGDVLATEKVATRPQIWTALGATLGDVTSLQVQPAGEGCVGGTLTSLTVVDGERVLVDLVIDDCAGANAEATAAVTAWIAPAREQFPPMETLAPEGE